MGLQSINVRDHKIKAQRKILKEIIVIRKDWETVKVQGGGPNVKVTVLVQEHKALEADKNTVLEEDKVLVESLVLEEDTVLEEDIVQVEDIVLVEIVPEDIVLDNIAPEDIVPEDIVQEDIVPENIVHEDEVLDQSIVPIEGTAQDQNIIQEEA